MMTKKIIVAFSLLTSCLFLFSITACSEKNRTNKDISSQTDALSPKIIPLDTAFMDSSSILPTKSSKGNDDTDPDKPHTLNSSH